MRILPHDKAAEYRRLAEEARTMAKRAWIQDAHDKLLATARQFETLADIEERGLRKTAPVQGSRPERRSTNADAVVPSGQRHRYFFDYDDGDQFIVDEVGLEVADLETARMLACRALGDMARDGLTAGDRREFSINVRGETGEVFLHATLTFAVDEGSKAHEREGLYEGLLQHR